MTHFAVVHQKKYPQKIVQLQVGIGMQAHFMECSNK